jgi:flagella basal body P-ring formation protein FlgA
MAPMKPYVAQAPAIEPGQKLTLTAHAGPAVIERPVIALQEARKGDARLFVKTDDGEVFSAPIQSAVEQ